MEVVAVNDPDDITSAERAAELRKCAEKSEAFDVLKLSAAEREYLLMTTHVERERQMLARIESLAEDRPQRMEFVRAGRAPLAANLRMQDILQRLTGSVKEELRGGMAGGRELGVGRLVFCFDQTRPMPIHYERTFAGWPGGMQCLHLPSAERRPNRN
jgi:hypothetical protein